MPAEVQITNRNSLSSKRLTARLQDSDSGDAVLDFIIGPGEAAIIPIMNTMTLVVNISAVEGEETDTVFADAYATANTTRQAAH